MSWIENLLIIIGASLEVFVAMECQGSLVKKINKKTLAKVCMAVVLVQLVTMFLGVFLTELLYRKNPVSDEALLGEILAVLIFVLLAVRLIVLAVKNEWLTERLENSMEARKIVHIAGIGGLYAFFAGVAFGCVGTNIPITMAILAVVTIVLIISGAYFGYNFGFEQKKKVYIVGAVLFFIAGADVILRQVMHLF